MDSNDILDSLFQMVQDIIEGITLPTGKTLMPAFFASVIITVSAIASQLFFDLSCIDWRGGLLAVLCLGVLVFIERRGMNEVSRLYRAAKSRAVAVAARAKRPGAGKQTDGADVAGEPGVSEN